MIIINLQDRPNTYTKKDGNTFRIMAFAKVSLEEALISNEMRDAHAAGVIRISPEASVDTISNVKIRIKKEAK